MKRLIALGLIILLSGCKGGNIVRFEQRSVAGISSIDIGEYTIPVISLTSGPSLSVYQTKDSPCLIQLSGHASTTNTTSALGIYNSVEEKHIEFSGTFQVSNTNDVNSTEGH